MRPGFSSHNTPNAMLANAILLCECCLRKLGRTNVLDVCFRQLGRIMFFAFFVVRAVSTFAHHVSHIFGMRSDREMFWVNARWVVTRMHNLHSMGNNRLMLNHPRNAVSHVHFPLVVINSEKTLAPFILAGSPQPTFIRRRFLYFVPKPFVKLFIKHRVYIRALGEPIKLYSLLGGATGNVLTAL